VAEPITQPVTTPLAAPLDLTDASVAAAVAIEPTPENSIVTESKDRTYRPIVLAYVLSVIAVSFAAQAILLARTHNLKPSNISAFLFFALLALAAELKPISWLGPDKGGIAASWAFLLGLFFTAPLPTAVLATSGIALIARCVNRQPLLRIAFNTAQPALSLLSAVLVVQTSGYVAAGGYSDGGPLTGWVVCSLAVGCLGFIINMTLTSLAIALSNRISVLALMRGAMGSTMAMDLMLIGLAPVFTVVVTAGLLLGVILATIVWAIHKTSTLALGQHHEATHDFLTALPNRRSLYEQSTVAIAGARRRGEGLAVLQVNIDAFKGINDRLGRAVGDQVLCAVAERLRKDRRGSDIVARLAGDDFIVVLNSPCNRADAMRVAGTILAELQRPLLLGNVPLSVGASIGVATFPDHGDDIDTLVSAADSAMYRAKRTHDGPELYSDEHSRSGPARMFLAGEMLNALKNDEFFLAFQPKLDLQSNVIVGVEALVRWTHPVRGTLYPDAFITTAEQTDLMQPLTEYVLDKALQQCSLWHAEGFYLSVGVNVSARNVHDRSFVESVSRLLTFHNLDPRWLELELTENTVMADPERTALALQELRALGVQIALDDFGTGFSSLANLRFLPIDRVKIDKSFVFGMLHSRKDESIVRSIIDLASNLGLGTVAEGVESREVLDRLMELDCQTVQGYFIGKPVSALEIRKLCRDGEYLPPPSKNLLT
jgi:diguanylate cyclase (GGDEF)-like protein